MSNIFEQIHSSFKKFISSNFNLPENSPEIINLELKLNTDKARDTFADLNSNIAMILAKKLRKSPIEIAQEISDKFQEPKYIENISVAKPGFINIFLNKAAFVELLADINKDKFSFFKSDIKKNNYNIEFVSANPTGPMHLGHGRGAIIGDVLGNILSFLGHTVTKEFYINDAGNQINKLGLSFKVRCQQVLGHDIELPEESYKGEYLLDLAQTFIKENKLNLEELLKKDNNFFSDYAKEKLLAKTKKTLEDYGVNFDVWFSEKSLHDSGSIEVSIDKLSKNNFIYEKDDATWFRSTEFNDDKDRVVKKSNGELTYAAADIAYLQNKANRDFNSLVMILGQDHHSYATRLQGLKQALGLDNINLDIIIYQLVSMQSSGEAVRMSKRAGNIVTLRGVIDTVGKDVARFFYLNRKADSQLEFNLDLALKKTDENPVYYIQYAYVRIKSILRKALEEYKLDINKLDISNFNNITESEYLVLKKILDLKYLLSSINKTNQTHLLAYYALDLARSFHSYYGKCKVLDKDNLELTKARLLILKQLELALDITLELLGLDKPEVM